MLDALAAPAGADPFDGVEFGGIGRQAGRRSCNADHAVVPKTQLAHVLSATAINLVRADAWLNGTPLGTTRVSHLARLDLAA